MINKEKIKSFLSIPSLNFREIYNIPNALSIVRIFLIIPFVINTMDENYLKAVEILFWSGVTDLLDGFLARILNQQTKFGEIIDPIADKLTLISIMVCLGIKFKSVVPFMLILIFKELIMLIAGAFILKKTKKAIKAKWYGKLGTAFFYFSISVIVIMKALWEIENKFLTDTLMIITSLLMLQALIRYAIEFVSIVHVNKCNN